MNKEEIIEESPYCEVCGHCGDIGCCGIRNFIEEHIRNKTNCKNEEPIINELISLCEYKDEIFKENKQLKDNWNKLKEEIQYQLERQYDIDKFAEEQGFATYNPVRLNIEHIRNKMQELEKGSEE